MKYWKFDNNSLTFRRSKKIRRTLFRMSIYAVSSIVLCIIYYFVFSLFFETSQEKKMKTDYMKMEKSYDSMNIVFIKTKNVLDNLKKQDKLIYRSVFKTNPVEADADTKGKSIDFTGNMNNSQIVEQNYERVNNLTNRFFLNQKRIELYIKKISDTSFNINEIPAVQPIENKDLKRTGASVGMKIHPIYRVLRLHRGIDFTVPVGTRVFATADGVVERIVKGNGGKGNIVIIKHGNGFKTLYAHLDKILVSEKTKVKRGKIIALSGDSGMSIWPHLHYEVWKDGKFIDPITCFFAELNPIEIDKMREISTNSGQSLD